MSYTQKSLDELRAHNAERTKHLGPAVDIAQAMSLGDNDPLMEYVMVGVENYDADHAIDVTTEMVVVGFNK